MDAATDDRRLRPTDYLWLLVLCAALSAPALLDGRWLTTHEATHCLNVREMFDSGNFLIPTYGGRPWLERPPVPHWFTGAFAELFADTSTTWAMRIGSIVVAAGAVLAVARSVAGCFGRGFGVASGAVLATFREFAAYAVGPETDIFVASFVTLAGALFLRAESSGQESGVTSQESGVTGQGRGFNTFRGLRGSWLPGGRGALRRGRRARTRRRRCKFRIAAVA